MDEREMYWDGRFGAEGAIWGDQASDAAKEAARIFRDARVGSVCVPGCAYGRNSLFLAQSGFTVSASDISGEAIRIARKTAADVRCRNITYRQTDIFRDTTDQTYDALLSINLLHLFDSQKAREILDLFADRLKPGGLLVLTVMSVHDGDFGKGDRVDSYTYESKKGRPLRYYDIPSLRDALPDTFVEREIREITEHENHGGKEHDHAMLWVVAQKKTNET